MQNGATANSVNNANNPDIYNYGGSLNGVNATASIVNNSGRAPANATVIPNVNHANNVNNNKAANANRTVNPNYPYNSGANAAVLNNGGVITPNYGSAVATPQQWLSGKFRQ